MKKSKSKKIVTLGVYSEDLEKLRDKMMKRETFLDKFHEMVLKEIK